MSEQDRSATDLEDADPLDETLVAYLDGQLDAQQSERLEARLASDPQARARLSELDRVWNALDTLPRHCASDAFTRTTVEMAAFTASDRGDRPSRRARWAVAAAAGVGVAIGALITLGVVTGPQRAMLADLPTVLHADALEQAGSVEFLRRLGEAAPQAAAPSPAAREAADEWARLESASLPDRRAWLDGLDPSALAEVNDKLAAWNGVTPTRRDTLRETSQELAAAPDPQPLRQAALAYDELVGALPASYQSRLRQMAEDERLAEVVRRGDDWRREAALRLTDAERGAFREAIERIAAGGGFKRLAGLAESQRRGAQRLFERRPEVALMMIAYGASAGFDDRRFLDGDRPAADEMRRRVQQQWAEWEAQLTGALPPRVQEELSEAESDASRARTIARLLRDSARGDLATAFSELDDRALERVLLEPEDRFLEELGEATTFGPDFGPPWGWDRRGPRPPFDRRRDGPPGGPRPPPSPGARGPGAPPRQG
ncbi:hypothetical protein [Botrimarina sp.]|uniref:anti-sigma factor family protein n=1 Tax=Botrimarina sp. TaxID=2795802 RepID=UPI0032EF3FCB